jgi:RNA ligase (TIGR02306 family)
LSSHDCRRWHRSLQLSGDIPSLEKNQMRKLATVRTVSEIRPITGADMIVLAVVDGWKCVVKKDEFEAGDLAVYCEIDSFLPVKPEFEFLRKSSFKRMGDQEGFRLRTVKLRGQISQGLLLPLSVLDRPAEPGEDVTDELGIEKYEPPTPACLSGKVVGPFPATVQKTDEERIQNLASDYDSFTEHSFYVTEKLDGTSFTAIFDGELSVCGRNWQLAPDDSNSYWQIANRLELASHIHSLGRRIAIQGELIGPGIQGNRYKLKQAELYVFNVFDLDQFAYVEKEEVASICEQLGLQTVPFIELRSIPETIDEILEIAEGKSVLNPQTEREGLVWVSGSGQERISFKTISNKFLARGGD